MTAPATATEARPAADVAMCRLLRLPVQRPLTRSRAEREADVQKAFSLSLLVSAARCVLTYLVLPFLLPVLGVAKGVGPWIGITFAVVAIVFNVRSIRRFWAADHKWRWGYTAIGSSVIVLLLVLIARDITDLLT